MAAMETAGVGQKVAERYPDNGHASLPTGLPPVCKSPQRGHMPPGKAFIHPMMTGFGSHCGVSRAWMPGRLGFPPLVWGSLGSPQDSGLV